MSKARRWVIIVLSLAVLVMIGINMAEKDDTAQVVVNNNDPTYKSEHTDTLVYNPEGALSYRLIAQHVEYYSDQAVSWFTQPVLTTFDKDKIPTWSVKADKAKRPMTGCSIYMDTLKSTHLCRTLNFAESRRITRRSIW